MAVIVKYVVVRNGKEDMTFTTKKEADAYDRMLDIAEGLYTFLQTAEVDIPDDKLDDLTFFMAKNREPLGRLLKGGNLAAPKKKADDTPAATGQEADQPSAKDETVKEKAPQTAKTSRGAKPKTVAA